MIEKDKIIEDYTECLNDKMNLENAIQSQKQKIIEEIEKKLFIPDGNSDFYAIEIGVWEDIKNGKN